LKLYKYSVSQGSPNSKYLNAAVKMNQYLMTVQGNSSNTGINGGLAGSAPLNGPYGTNLNLSWAVKFFVDDLNLEAQVLAKTSIAIAGLDPGKWSFPAGALGFNNIGGTLLIGGTLQYNGPAAGFGPRAVAMKNGANIPFSDGIVEYNVEGTGGYDEFGLMYRGQNPQTSNSYIFYPTVYNSQNDWQLYSRQSSASINVGSGGQFAEGTWYAVKAAIGGTSHTFSINGVPTIAATDATFSSGTFGLMAWGNSVSSVTNFRLRQYSVSEPTTVVGSAQTNPRKDSRSSDSDRNGDQHDDHKPQQDRSDKHNDHEDD
jgi:hypothetical protein